MLQQPALPRESPEEELKIDARAGCQRAAAISASNGRQVGARRTQSDAYVGAITHQDDGSITRNIKYRLHSHANL